MAYGIRWIIQNQNELKYIRKENWEAKKQNIIFYWCLERALANIFIEKKGWILEALNQIVLWSKYNRFFIRKYYLISF